MKKIVFGLIVLLAFVGCSKDKCEYNECGIMAPAAEIQAVKDYLASKGITNATQHCSGMFYVVDDAGSGTAPDFCSTVAVTYQGTLTNGTQFDKATTPVAFGLGEVITGFRNGIPLVKKGGRIHLYVPPSLGYGSGPYGNIPANSVLIFDVTLADIQ
jgi:FKBP-type peptidyl-prolyl cis-trans isomerase FkpA